MVQIGEIYIGGKERHPHNGNVYNSGVAFSLSKKSPVDGIYEFESGKWEIEIQKNNQNIVARCRDILPEEQILRTGFDFCQKYLDLLSVAQKITLSIDNPGQEYILVFNHDGRMIGRIVTNGDWGMSVEVTATVKDKDGNVVEQPPVPQPNWIPAFRYYRISQSGSDLYDAYRNLYLAFESLIQGITPINSREREIDWLHRALNEIGKKVPLQNLVPNGEDPVQYLTELYGIRCKTFHAKNRDYILPHEWPEAENLSEAYEGLLQIWREAAVAFVNVPGGGGVVTYQGFMFMMDNVANQGIMMQITEDPSPENITDTQISPLGHPFYSTTESSYIRDYRPGIVLFKGDFENPDDIKLGSIHRIGLKSGETLYSVAFYEDGIKPLGIDKLESHETFRLVNKSSPKIIF
jgi:hypothetical protein